MDEVFCSVVKLPRFYDGTSRISIRGWVSGSPFSCWNWFLELGVDYAAFGIFVWLWREQLRGIQSLSTSRHSLCRRGHAPLNNVVARDFYSPEDGVLLTPYKWFPRSSAIPWFVFVSRWSITTSRENAEIDVLLLLVDSLIRLKVHATKFFTATFDDAA